MVINVSFWSWFAGVFLWYLLDYFAFVSLQMSLFSNLCNILIHLDMQFLSLNGFDCRINEASSRLFIHRDCTRIMHSGRKTMSCYRSFNYFDAVRQ